MPVGPLKFEIQKESTFGRATTVELPHNIIQTPVFMPVGTQGTLKGITTSQIQDLGPKIMLSNTFFLNLRPGTDVLDNFSGLHNFSGIRTNFLTDSGGFQMVSLLDLTEITEQGVEFTSPVDSKRLMLTPEESIRTQQSIGSDVMMALDDVVSAELDPVKDKARIEEATQRTTRWLDRCISAHTSPSQTLFGICQGHLDISPNGFRDQCIQVMRERKDQMGGIAIGGLSGGETKSTFWRVVRHCCINLPQDKPRYLMGVGYPLDVVVCAALGVDMFDCVYATRTGRFGTAFSYEGEVNLTREAFSSQRGTIVEGCKCETCAKGVSRAYLNCLLKENEATGGVMVSIHNVHFLLQLMRDMRQAIVDGKSEEFVQGFVTKWCQGKIPEWVAEAMQSLGMKI
ncbi:Queuine_tRNA-ribosyltransferase [Hexamita inflata]|uniref:Queuine tRNA-ribosyltransferase catalytic subunit 1 n=1 Tax=Hexamita inflata TaxID=28002 RepID=A0AA86PW78_9EUKA|nr:Queuine tRNA-ribosyltransferase [Hexamita inflata]